MNVKTTTKMMKITVMLVLLFSIVCLPSPVQADGATIWKVTVTRVYNGVNGTITVWENGNWVGSNQNITFDYTESAGITVTLYATGGSPDYYYQVRNMSTGSSTSYTTSATDRNLYPYQPIAGYYAVQVDGNWLDGSIDNQFRLIPQYSDLEITSGPTPSVSGPYCVNQTINWTSTTQNQNSSIVGGNPEIGYYIGTSTSDYSNQWDTDSLGSIDGYPDSSDENEDYIFTASDVGTRYMNFWADWDDTIEETDEGNNKESSSSFVVNPAPTAEFSGSPRTGPPGTQVCFTNLSTGNPSSYEWDFGENGQTSLATEPCYTYTSPGFKTVSLTATNGCDNNQETKDNYIEISKYPSTTNIISDVPDPSQPGENYTVSVTVTGSAGTPTGTVNATDGNDSCTITLSGGSGSCILTSSLTPGSPTITATYSGDANYEPSSDTEGHTVDTYSTTTTITSDDPDPSNVGENYAVNVSVTAASGTPTGSVSISDGTNSCNATLTSGNGSCNIASSIPGPVTLTANYSGDNDYQTSSDTEPHTVNDNAPVISDIRFTNINDDQISVSWLTDVDANGSINYGTTGSLGSSAVDVRGAAHLDDTHYVTIIDLEPNTEYYVDVISGSTTDDNGGNHYIVSTGPVLSIPSPDSVYGQVFKSDTTTPAEGAITYFTLQDNNASGSPGTSAEMSSLVDSSGYWFYPLGNVRTSDLSAAFAYSSNGDNLVFDVQGGADGQACATIDTANDSPASDLVLGTCGYEIYLPLISSSTADPRVQNEDIPTTTISVDQSQGPQWPWTYWVHDQFTYYFTLIIGIFI